MNSNPSNPTSENIEFQNQERAAETPATAFAPLPIRERTTLEVLDTSVKLYRRYFSVLLPWSALVSATYLLASFIPFISILAFPLVYGSVSCAIAAAVRGERITFGQVWSFTKPRYGPLIGVTLLSSLVAGLAALALFIVGMVIFGIGVYILQGLPEAVSIVAAIVGFLLAIGGLSALGAVMFGWMSMVPIVACLEDDKRGTASMGRAWTLFIGHWKRVFSISILLGLAGLVALGIIGGLLYVAGVGTNAFTTVDESSILGLMFGFTAIYMVLITFWTPAQAMVVAVLYLDLRVRKEALDIEWTDYTSKPAMQTSTGMVPQGYNGAMPAEMLTPAEQLSPSSFGTTGGAAATNSPMVEISVTTPPVTNVPAVSDNPFVFPTTPAPSPVNAVPFEAESSSFSPPPFSVEANIPPSPWSTGSLQPNEVQPPATPPLDVKPDEPKPEDSHEPRF